MKTLVVTGGIGSGKSTVCRYFASKGVPVYDSDSRTRRLYDTDPGLVRRLGEALGTVIADSEGRVCRRKLASVIFSDPGKLQVLESIVHPAVKEDFIFWRDSFRSGDVPFVVMESAIILEKPLFKDIADRILVVDAPLQTRLERACGRDGAAEEQVRERMSRQKLLNDISEGKVRPDVDYVIVNDADEASLFSKAEAVYLSMCASEPRHSK